MNKIKYFFLLQLLLRLQIKNNNIKIIKLEELVNKRYYEIYEFNKYRNINNAKEIIEKIILEIKNYENKIKLLQEKNKLLVANYKFYKNKLKSK